MAAVRKMFYARLAAQNMRKNARTYVPYLIASVFTVAMFFIIATLADSSALASMRGGQSLEVTLGFGIYVVGIFAVIFLFYTNSFLVKRRKKEFGLFNILGMEKKHIGRIIAYETLYTALISIVPGIGLGLAFYKLVILLLMKIMQFDLKFGFEFSSQAFLTTAALFAAIFALTLLNSLRQIHLAKPIELLRGGQTGEREPKTKWALAVLGVLCLGGGYYISITTTQPLQALTLFFLAVVLVIVGTYCLFTAGSIAVLKALRKNRRYYYKTSHFINVSGMMYRMKQNAVGLANICILSTMVLVMVSTTVSLYIGMEDAVRRMYPRDIVTEEHLMIDPDGGADESQNIPDIAGRLLSERGLRPENELKYTYMDVPMLRSGTDFDYNPRGYTSEFNGAAYDLILLPADDFNALTGGALALEDDEACVFSGKRIYDGGEISIAGERFRVRESGLLPDGLSLTDSYAINADENILHVVVSGEDTLERMFRRQTGEGGASVYPLRKYYAFDLNAPDETVNEVFEAISDTVTSQRFSGRLDTQGDSRDAFLGMYGGLFFLGIFLGLTFMMAAVLIIYYKQVSEGYEDKARFAIMQKVGLSRREVRKTIRAQILTMFFLPLLVACVHIAFAFPVITRLLRILYLTNVPLFAACTAGSIAIFALFYAVVFSLTAKVYYRIVGEN